MGRWALKKKAIPLVEILLVSIIAIALQFPVPPESQGAVVGPKVGDCLTYPIGAIYVNTARPKIVKCANLHNAEVYRIGKIRAGVRIQELSTIELTQIADQTCMPWRGESKFFNAWVFRIPTNAEWEKGARWIRCEAIALKFDSANSDGQSSVLNFRGKKLDIK
jgi:hypothetical protein